MRRIPPKKAPDVKSLGTQLSNLGRGVPLFVWRKHPNPIEMTDFNVTHYPAHACWRALSIYI